MSEKDECAVLPSVLKDWVKYVVVYSHQDKAAYSIGIKHILNTKGAEDLFRRLSRQQFRQHRKPIHGFLCPSMNNFSPCPFGRNCRDIHMTHDGISERRMWSRSLQLRPSTASPAATSTSHTVESVEQALLQPVCALTLAFSTTSTPVVISNTSVSQVPFRPTHFPASLTSESNSVMSRLLHSQVPHPTFPSNYSFYPHFNVNEPYITQAMASPIARSPADSYRSGISTYNEGSFQSISQVPPSSPSWFGACPHCGGHWSKEPKAFLHLPIELLSTLNNAAGQNINASVKFPCEVTVTVCGGPPP